MSDIDYAFYDKLEVFTILEAAYLWLEIDPPQPDTPVPQKVKMMSENMLSVCKENSILIPYKNMFGDSVISSYSKATREDLIKIARLMSHEPKFLFPEMREHKDNGIDIDELEKPIRESEREQLHYIIATILRMYGKTIETHGIITEISRAAKEELKYDISVDKVTNRFKEIRKTIT